MYSLILPSGSASSDLMHVQDEHHESVVKWSHAQDIGNQQGSEYSMTYLLCHEKRVSVLFRLIANLTLATLTLSTTMMTVITPINPMLGLPLNSKYRLRHI